MLETFHDKDEDFVKVGKPESIENEDQLIFIKVLHRKIASTDKTVKTVKKHSKLVPPNKSIRDMFKNSPVNFCFFNPPLPPPLFRFLKLILSSPVPFPAGPRFQIGIEYSHQIEI